LMQLLSSITNLNLLKFPALFVPFRSLVDV
jgi:hypothetical protein